MDVLSTTATDATPSSSSPVERRPNYELDIALMERERAQAADHTRRPNYELDIALMERERAQAADHTRRVERSHGKWLCEDVPDPRVVFIHFIDHIRFANQMHRFERFLKYTIAHATDPRRFPNPPRVIAMVPGSVSWNEWMEYDSASAELKRREGREPRWDSTCPSGRDAGALEGDALSLLANDLVPKNRNFCVPKNMATGDFRGMAYVTFRTPELAQRFLRSVAYYSGLQVLTGVDQPPGGILRAKAELSRSTKATGAEMAARAAGHKRGRDFMELSSGAPVAPSGATKSAHEARGVARLQHVASSKSAKRGRYSHWPAHSHCPW